MIQFITTMRRAALLLFLPGLSALLSSMPGLAFASPNTHLASLCNTGQLCVNIQQVTPESYTQLLTYVSVVGPNGQPIVGLDSSSASVSIDGKPAQLQGVTGVTDISQPLYAAVLLDTSTTMGYDHKLPDAEAAISAFGQSLNEQDQVGFYQIAGNGPAGVKRLLNFTTAHSQLASVVNSLPAPGADVKAPIYDALYQVAQDMASLPGRKLVILQTDMHDDSSVHSLEQSLSLLQQVHLPVYTIGLGADADLATLQNISQTTGGTSFDYTDAASLSASYQTILSQLRNSYQLTVQTAQPLAVGTHTVQVDVAYQGQTYTASSQVKIAATSLVLHLSPTPAGQIVGTATMSLEVSGDDLPIRSVAISIDGKSVTATHAGSRYQFTWDTRFTLPGTHQLSVTVTDVAGNKATLHQALKVGVDWAFWLWPLLGLVVLVLLLVSWRLFRYRFGSPLEGTLTVRDAAGRIAQIALGQDVKGSRLRMKITPDGVIIGANVPRKKIRFEGPTQSVPAKNSKEARTVHGQLFVAYERTSSEETPRIRMQYFQELGKDHQTLELIDGVSKKVGGGYRLGFSDD